MKIKPQNDDPNSSHANPIVHPQKVLKSFNPTTTTPDSKLAQKRHNTKEEDL